MYTLGLSHGYRDTRPPISMSEPSHEVHRAYERYLHMIGHTFAKYHVPSSVQPVLWCSLKNAQWDPMCQVDEIRCRFISPDDTPHKYVLMQGALHTTVALLALDQDLQTTFREYRDMCSVAITQRHEARREPLQKADACPTEAEQVAYAEV